MAQARNAGPRRGSKNDVEKEEEIDNNGYIQVYVKPLEQGSLMYILKWLGVQKANFSPQQVGLCYGTAALVFSVLLYQLLRYDVGMLVQRLCSVLVPMFSITCAFYWLSLYLRRTWNATSVYVLFCSCFFGECFAQICFRDWGEGPSTPGIADHVEHSDESKGSASDTVSSAVLSNYTTQPLVIVCVLFFISIASVFSSLETSHSACVISLISFTRFLACSGLQDIPFSLRPFLAYSCGFAGNIVAKYMETVFKPQIQNITTHDGKIPVIKRRRSSSSTAHTFSAHRSTRRTSLPALIQKSQVGSSINSCAMYSMHLICSSKHGEKSVEIMLPDHVSILSYFSLILWQECVLAFLFKYLMLLYHVPAT
ncbi:cGMP-inhibited 3',5'-cyclic phosphodiesterase b [Plakobranchus ocellatus]|uniref:cGMP-inhibited 3',5'-cyclic phosphodiesterase b n=1 Tax=Plakobranchus ocellatus TaxID=259542 RepID=A0AAV3Y3U1_9GAST|nr:cGMP-inhibited 3',5'-cyclic phosphodiesterase b [Plakobranchus ocellatus]